VPVRTAKALERVIGPILKLSDSGAGAEGASEALGPGADGVRRIAVPIANGELAMHFGHCEAFALVEVDPDAKAIVKTEEIAAPEHQPGLLPRWLHERGANLVIAGGMGSRAQNLFAECGIQVVTGASGGTPEAIAQAWLDGALQTGANVCDH